MSSLRTILYRKTDSRTLAAFRMLIGLWFFIDYVSMLVSGRVQEAYINNTMNFPFYGFEWVHPLPGNWMLVLFTFIALTGISIMLGYRYRLSLLLFIGTHLYVFLIDIVYSLNKFYLFLVIAFVLLFIDSHRKWSLDVKQGRVKESEYLPAWNLLIFQGFYGMIYIYSGISKFTYDWLVMNQPLKTFFSWVWLFQQLPEAGYNLVVRAFSWGGILFDLSIFWLLTNSRTNVFGNIWQWTFHLLNFIFLGIGSLSLFMGATTWLLFPTPWLKRKLSLNTFDPEEQVEHELRLSGTQATILMVFLLVQTILPHRHYLTESNVNLSEKGHRFSWRLMTRTKSGSSSKFTIREPSSGESWTILPWTILTPRQYRKMSAETDLIITFAHYLEREWHKKGYKNVEVYADVNVILNGRKPQKLVDPALDLTQVSRTYIQDKITQPLQKE